MGNEFFEKPILYSPYDYPTRSTIHVNFNTSKTDRWETDSRRCHVNWAILDSDWEAEFCRVAEAHPKVISYVNNLKQYGRWAVAEFTEVYQIEADFEAEVEAEFNKMIDSVTAESPSMEAHT